MAYTHKIKYLGHLVHGQILGRVDSLSVPGNQFEAQNKEIEMKNLFLMMALVMVSGAAYAKKNCTDVPKDKWMKEEDFKKRLEGEGYKIRKFKQPGSCYEIYGMNKEGKDVEIYFNPIDGSVVKAETK